jgi:hypothetical protein
MTPWNTFVRQYARKYGICYGCAMSSEEAQLSYKMGIDIPYKTRDDIMRECVPKLPERFKKPPELTPANDKALQLLREKALKKRSGRAITYIPGSPSPRADRSAELERFNRAIDAVVERGTRPRSPRLKSNFEDLAQQYIDEYSRPRMTGSGKPSKRGQIVKKVMAQKGLSLIEASKYVKANGLY